MTPRAASVSPQAGLPQAHLSFPAPNCYDSQAPTPQDSEMAATAAQSASDQAFYRIGEVSRLTDTKPFVLRYWETEFPMLQPVKSANGHRLYRQEDVDLVLRIKRLLYDEGYTIAGARRYLREQNEAHDADGSGGNSMAFAGVNAGQILNRKMLLDLRDSLRAFLTLLERK
jgi:DNA-binding transcriptional MerR regulator